MSTLLEVRNLHVRYGKVEALHGASLVVDEGTIVSMIGPNGAGKSTTLNAIAGALPSRGEILWEGKSIDHLGVEERLRLGLTLVPESRELFSAMTVEENLVLGAFTRRKDSGWIKLGLEQVYAQFGRLRERRRQLAGTLSGGERQMLALGRALMSKPKLLMLDEPSLGLAPLIVKEIFEIILSLKSTGVSILLVEQNARAALKASCYAYVLESGEITLSGTSDSIGSDDRIIQSYLGFGNTGTNRAQSA
jgi:branched-chain amino acid transport system ATP-binding protein